MVLKNPVMTTVRTKTEKRANPPVLGIGLRWTFLSEGSSRASILIPSHSARGVNISERISATVKVARIVVIVSVYEFRVKFMGCGLRVAD